MELDLVELKLVAACMFFLPVESPWYQRVTPTPINWPLCPDGTWAVREECSKVKVCNESANWFPQYTDNVLWVPANFPLPYCGSPMTGHLLVTLLFGGWGWKLKTCSVIWINNNMPRETERLQSQGGSLLIKAAWWIQQLVNKDEW